MAISSSLSDDVDRDTTSASAASESTSVSFLTGSTSGTSSDAPENLKLKNGFAELGIC